VTVNGNEVDSSKLVRVGNAPATNTDTKPDTETSA